MNIEKYRPSSGTEGECFYSEWCAKCKREAGFIKDPSNGEGCSILASTYILNLSDPDYPEELTYDEDNEPCCTAFKSNESKQVNDMRYRFQLEKKGQLTLAV